MRVLIVSQYFWPESFLINDVALGLKERGYEVTVYTGKPNYPGGSFFPGYGLFDRSSEDYHGIRVIRVPLVPRGNGGRIRLALNYLSFALLASLLAPLRCRGDFDVMLVYEPSPITVGVPALVVKALKGTPLLFWVLDLWPESVAAAGALRSARVLGWIGRLVRFIYRHCDRILVPSNGFVPNLLAAGVSKERIRYFPNWAEPVFVACPRSEPPPVPLPAGFRVMVAGNVGAAQDFPAMLAAAEQLSDCPDIHWIVLGEGRMLDWVRKEVAARNLSATVHLLGHHPAASMPAFFAHADVMLLALRNEPIFARTVPARLQAYLACGRPIVGMLDGEGARIIREANAGLACPAGSSEALADAVLRLSRLEPAEREGLGANGLAYSRAEFGREFLFDRLEDWIRELAATGRGRAV
jgi:glycosyltransferase involved in cell wall biosynthesis